MDIARQSTNELCLILINYVVDNEEKTLNQNLDRVSLGNYFVLLLAKSNTLLYTCNFIKTESDKERASAVYRVFAEWDHWLYKSTNKEKVQE